MSKPVLLITLNLKMWIANDVIDLTPPRRWKKKMEEQLFPVTPDFAWTGRRELAYLKDFPKWQ